MMTKQQPRNIFLIGPMGAGKSSVGRALAHQLKMTFYDTDEEIEKRTGVDIGWIFDIEGEEGFRARETEVLDDLTQRSGIVLATGGGTILEETNQRLLTERGIVVYLKVSLSLQDNRTINESRRPLLRVSNRQEVLERLHVEREPIYEKLAHFELLTDKRNVRTVADDIAAWFKKQ